MQSLVRWYFVAYESESSLKVMANDCFLNVTRVDRCSSTLVMVRFRAADKG